MKKTFKQFGLAVLIAAIALNAMLITGCNDNSDDSDNSSADSKKYDAIELLANRWDRGEQWSNGFSIKLSDFSTVEPKQGDVLQFKISGVSDKELKYFQIQLFNHNDDWSEGKWLGDSNSTELPKAFNDRIFNIKIWDNPEPSAPIYLNLVNELWKKDESGVYTYDSGEVLGDTPNGTVMATINNFSISVVKVDDSEDDDDDDNDGPGVEYTDVVYSQDGSKVTLYIDGVGVPRLAQRAMSTNSAMMAFDYLEVIFIANGTTVRGQWEMGQSAGISGVARGIDYAWSAGSTASGPVALLAVGRKDSKTLLGIGNIREVNGVAGTTIYTGTKSVTFYIEAIKTGLVAGGDSPSNTSDSFDFVSSGSTIPTWTRAGHSARFTFGSTSYPAYFLPEENNSIQNAKYEFFGAAATFAQQIRLNADPATIQKRPPRYMYGGRYSQTKMDYVDAKTTVTLGTYTSTAGSPLVPVIPLVFTSKGTGIFSFYIEIPVYILTNTDAVAWKIRTGLGSELYSLDDGVGAGGCVLMSVGVLSPEDWLEIGWEYLQ